VAIRSAPDQGFQNFILFTTPLDTHTASDGDSVRSYSHQFSMLRALWSNTELRMTAESAAFGGDFMTANLQIEYYLLKI
jgi:hypothetical protein